MQNLRQKGWEGRSCPSQTAESKFDLIRFFILIYSAGRYFPPLGRAPVIKKIIVYSLAEAFNFCK